MFAKSGMEAFACVRGGQTQRPPKQTHCDAGCSQSVAPSVTRPWPARLTFTIGTSTLLMTHMLAR